MTETLTAPAAFEKEIRKSRFLARALPVDSPEAAMAFIREIATEDATHHCWAWRITPQYRSDDDGEPSGTAGRPILQVIEGQNLDRVAIVVTRWYGGIKLGAGGLVRAYGGTAAECLRLAERTPIVPTSRITFHCPFADLALIQSRLPSFNATIESETFNATGATLITLVPTARTEEMISHITNLTRGQSTPRILD